MRWPIASGKPALLFRFPQGRISWFWWSPDRRTLLFTARAGQAMNAWIWRVGTPSPQQLTRFPTGTIYNCSWSPDGTTLFLKQGVPTTDIVLIRGIK
jgi:Tol biopolymer transport system component